MNIKERTEYFTAILMYKCLNDLAPTYLSNKFNFVSDAHPYSTRSTTNNKLALPKPNSELLKKSFYYNGSRIWNELPSNICNHRRVQRGGSGGPDPPFSWTPPLFICDPPLQPNPISQTNVM